MSQLTLEPIADADVDALWNGPSRTAAPMPDGTTTVITCRVCGARDTMPIEWGGLVCGNCRADLPKTRAHAEAMAAGVLERATANDDAWFAQQAALPDELAERWQTALDKRSQAEMQLARATNDRMWGNKTTAARIALEQEARAALEQVRARFARAAANPDNPLCQMVRDEQAYQERRAQLRDEAARWQIALQEIEAAEGLPF